MSSFLLIYMLRSYQEFNLVATSRGTITPAQSVMCSTKMDLFMYFLLRHKNYVDEYFYNLITGNASFMSQCSHLHLLSNFLFLASNSIIINSMSCRYGNRCVYQVLKYDFFIIHSVQVHLIQLITSVK